ncbi:MAG: VWA domain-containing protein [Phycisphaeraceae bacterium]|nr:VWA domain-containing protein [Phycisphaeraceae bacterium]
MTSALNWLLGLDALRPGMEGVEFGFERPLPAWAWALVTLAAVFVAWRAYRRLEGAITARFALGFLRAALLVLVAVLIAGPRLIKPNETEERDWLIVLADRSASMTVRDAARPTSAERIAREAQLAATLAETREVWRRLADDRVVLWLGFDSGAFELPASAEGPLPDLGDPIGRRTAIGRALEQALRRAAARPVSGVVVLSDGRSADDVPRAVTRRLEAERIPVFAVPLGADEPLPDLAVREVDAPRTAFVRDAVPVEVDLEQLGAPDAARAHGAVVELIDTDTGAVLDSKEVDWRDAQGADAAGARASARVVLTTRPARAGATKWSVRVRPGPGAPPDLIDDNNSADFAIELVDRPVRVLAIDGYPRWEYRFIKNLLVREQSISAAVMLLAPGRRYLQEGSIILDTLPRSPEEWAQFDLVLIGDVWPGVFTPEQLAMLRERIAIGGAGLIWIAGEGSTPGAWAGTAMADLLPFALPERAAAARAGSALPTFGGPVLMRPTLAADRLGVLRLADEPSAEAEGLYWPAALSSPATGWSMLYWAQRIDPAILKPTAEALAVAVPVENGAPVNDGGTFPLVLSMRYGAGRSLYVATDEIWRWRYGRGDFLPERFWVQMIRLLGRESLARSGKPALLEITPRRGEVDRPAQIELTLLDQALVESAPATMRVRIVREGSVDERAAPGTTPDDAATTELVLTSRAGVGSTGAGAARTYSATWLPTASGRYRIDASDPLIASAGGLSVRAEVWQADDEMRTPQTDHALLARLAESTGGRVLAPGDLSQLLDPNVLPKRRLRLAGEPDIETLWDTPLALILVMLLLTTEWAWRRLLKFA